MRRTCLILLLAALLAPGAAFALSGGQGGSLAVSGATGSLIVRGHGVIFGSFVSGSLVVLGYRPDEPGDSATVSGTSVHSDPGLTTYSGTDVRFLFPAGHYAIEFVGSGIDISAVGRGTAGATAGAGYPNGSFTLDGGRPQPFARVVGPQTFGGKGL